MRRKLKASDVAKDPSLIWNAFIDLVATGEYTNMNSAQRRAHLVFWYDAEVQNGGHLQYFENEAGKRHCEAVEALVSLGLDRHASVLRKAIQIWESEKRAPVSTAESFVERALEGKFDMCDSEYHGSMPTIVQRLESYLEEHQSEFVVIEDSAY